MNDYNNSQTLMCMNCTYVTHNLVSECLYKSSTSFLLLKKKVIKNVLFISYAPLTTAIHVISSYSLFPLSRPKYTLSSSPLPLLLLPSSTASLPISYSLSLIISTHPFPPLSFFLLLLQYRL